MVAVVDEVDEVVEVVTPQARLRSCLIVRSLLDIDSRKDLTEVKFQIDIFSIVKIII